MELETFMFESVALDRDQFIKLHKTPTLVFTPDALSGMTPETLRIDTPGSRIMRLEKTGQFIKKKLALAQQFKGDETTDDAIEEDLYATQCDDNEVPRTKKHKLRQLALNDEAHAANGRICKVTKGARNPFANIITIGRARNNDIVIDNGTVSKVHAFITKLKSVWYITDQDSTNKTYLNGATLVGKKNYPLKDNDKLSFGRESYATFFMPEGLWKFISLCNSLTEQMKPGKVVVPKRRR